MSIFKQLPARPLGKNGPQLPRLGLGLMNASGTYGLAGSDADRLAFLDEAYKMGEVFWDTGMFAPQPSAVQI
jgi:aryl-alcohol dehydrogenase-like predicted oxidoreductase